MTAAPLRLFVVAGEASGDALGAALVEALRRRRPVTLQGIGGPALAAAGLETLVPMAELAVMGLSAVIARLPRLLGHIRATARAAAAARPDLLLTIDSPDFGLRVDRQVRRLAPAIPIVHWVCPSVWAWRPGRARAMRGHVDQLLTLLPFEPAALARLHGPPGLFVGHPLVERLGQLRPGPDEARARADRDRPEVLVLPGSRRSEIARLLPVFAETVRRVAARCPGCRFTLPAVPHLATELEAAARSWPVPVETVSGEAAKWAAFRRARAALAASGTVTLELALSGVPTVAGYRLGVIEGAIARRLVRIPSVILPNIVLDDKVVPEFLLEFCEPVALSEALLACLDDGPARRRQLEGFARLDAVMEIGGAPPSERAAEAVTRFLDERAGAAPQRR